MVTSSESYDKCLFIVFEYESIEFYISYRLDGSAVWLSCAESDACRNVQIAKSVYAFFDRGLDCRSDEFYDSDLPADLVDETATLRYIWKF